MSFASQVKEFTKDRPVVMPKRDVEFISRIVCSEEAVSLVMKSVNTDLNIAYMKPADETALLADVNYYVYNCACKHGINLSKVLDVVHKANMDKKFPDGTFHRRDGG